MSRRWHLELHLKVVCPYKLIYLICQKRDSFMGLPDDKHSAMTKVYAKGSFIHRAATIENDFCQGSVYLVPQINRDREELRARGQYAHKCLCSLCTIQTRQRQGFRNKSFPSLTHFPGLDPLHIQGSKTLYKDDMTHFN